MASQQALLDELRQIAFDLPEAAGSLAEVAALGGPHTVMSHTDLGTLALAGDRAQKY